MTPNHSALTRVQELRALLAASTPAPWRYEHDTVCGPDIDEDLGTLGYYFGNGPDSKLLVALRNNADALLAVVEAAANVFEAENGDSLGRQVTAMGRLAKALAALGQP